MPRGDKSAYTDKQKRQAEHIEEGYETGEFRERGRTPRLGHRQQGNRRREEVRQWPRSTGKPGAIPERRSPRWKGGG